MYAHTRVQNLTEAKTSLSRVMTGFSPCIWCRTSEESQHFPPFLLCKVMLHRSHVKYRAYSFWNCLAAFRRLLHNLGIPWNFLGITCLTPPKRVPHGHKQTKKAILRSLYRCNKIKPQRGGRRAYSQRKWVESITSFLRVYKEKQKATCSHYPI